MPTPPRSPQERILRRELATLEGSIAGARRAGLEADPDLLTSRAELQARLAEVVVEADERHPHRIVSTPLSQVQAEPVRWLWRPMIPLAKVTLLDGDPGLGKSTIAADLAARVTSGGSMPDGSRSDLAGPADVVIISAEDGPADTIQPRCAVADADLDRIHVASTVDTIDADGSVFQQPWRLPDHVAALAELVRRLEAKLVVIDPVSAVLSASVNANRDQDVRATLRPLTGLAEQEGCAIVLIRHLNKTQGTEDLYRGMGSIGWTAAVRSSLLVAKDPSDPTGNRRVFGAYMSNLAVATASRYFEIVADKEDRARVAWGGPSPYSSRELLAAPNQDGESSECEEIATYLAKWVKTEGRITCKEARRRLGDHGFAVASNSGQKMVQRAARRAGLKTTEPGSFGGDRSYYHPDHPPSADIVASEDIGPSAVPTVSNRQNGRSRPSVDIPLAVSTLANGHSPEGPDVLPASP